MESSKKKKVNLQGKKDQLVDLKRLFKFKSFTERIASIHIDVTRKVKVPIQDPEDQDTYFNEGLSKWKELNCTLDFLDFLRGVQGKTGSLAQLIFHKEDLISHLKKCLAKRDTLAFEPLLDLLVQLARDLQEEFYPHFKDFFPVLVGMCNTINVDQIQCVFNTFAFLFKFLWRHMIRDLENVFNLYSELLIQSQKAHVRQFAAESFGFLLRKVRNQDLLVDMIISSLIARPEICVGVAQLLFEVSRGVAQQFHSCTSSFLPLLLTRLGQCADSSSDSASDPSLSCDQLTFRALSKMVELMAEHTRKEFSEPLWTSLLEHLSSTVEHFHAIVSDNSSEPDEEKVEAVSLRLSHTLHLLGIVTSWKRGSRVRDTAQLFEALRQVLVMDGLPWGTLNVALHWSASLILLSQDNPGWTKWTLDLVKVISERRKKEEVVLEEVEVVVTFYQEILTNLGNSIQMVLQYCLHYCESVVHMETAQPVIIRFLAELCLKKDPAIVGDSSTSVPLPPADMFLLDFNGGEAALLSAQQQLQLLKRPGHVRNEEASGGGQVLRVLVEKLGKGLSVLRGRLRRSGKERYDEDIKGACKEEEVLEWLWCVTVCVRYIRPVQRQTTDVLKEVFHILLELILDEGVGKAQKSVYQLLYAHTLSAVVGVASEGMLEEEVPLNDVLSILKCLPCSLPVLVSTLQYLSLLASSSICDQQSPLSSSVLEQLLPVLSPNLSSHLHPVRWLTLQILCQFDQLPLEGQPMEDGSGPMADVLEVCLKAESIAADVDYYRGKLLWLQKLKYSHSQVTSLPEVYREVPLRYLVGVLYVNFSLLWEPTSEIIRTHVVEENKQLFWKVFGELLAQASARVRDLEDDENTRVFDASSKQGKAWHDYVSSLFQYHLGLLSGMECRSPDHVTHRILLWKALAGSELSVVESRSRILVPLFLQFIEQEYSLKEDSLMETQDISSSRTSDDTTAAAAGGDAAAAGGDGAAAGGDGAAAGGDGAAGAAGVRGEEVVQAPATEGVCEEEEEEQNEEVEEVEEKVTKTSSGLAKKTVAQPAGRKSLTKTLVAMLKMFTGFQNPKSVYKKDDLWALYMKLLVHNYGEVQTLALAGLMTFKPPYLCPYKENFDRLLDDKSFKEELINFRFDADCAVVSIEHRDKLLPVLVRLLYGQMLKKGGGASKGGGVARKLVLRFLGGCEGNELGEFINLLTTPFHSISTDTQVAVDPCCVVPLKRQQGFFNMLGQMTSDLGRKLLPHLLRILQIVIHLRTTLTQLLDNRDKIVCHFIGAVKNLRQLATNKLTELFRKFSEFDFSPYHEQLLSAFVWPQLRQLSAQNLHSPTPLLKLLSVWTTQSHYWCLLSKPLPSCATPTDSDDPNEAGPHPILKYVFDCLNAPKVSAKICSLVMEMSVNLLGPSEGQGDLGSTHMEDDGVQPVDGRALVRPFIPKLLDYLSCVISECSYRGKLKKINGREKNLENEFLVLSHTSSFVTCPNQSTVLIKLLLPFVQHTEHFQKQEGAILQSVSNLVVIAHSASQHSRSLALLFQVLKERSSRNALCGIFRRLAEKDNQWGKTASIVAKLNAWNSRLVEEPDYDRRLEGYMEAKEMLAIAKSEKTTWTSASIDLVFPILQNALYSLLESSDMSLRDAAASFVSDLLKHVSLEDQEAFQLFILSSTVAAVKQGLRSKQDFAQREFVSVLSQLVKTFGEHQRFRGLCPLSHHDHDADFFLNVNHIQLHRRTRAFRKMAALCCSGEVGQTSCLDFVLPLANRVVFSSTSSMEQNLLAEAVNVIGAVCSHLSWTHFSFILRHYLRLLPKKRENQKNLIKVVIAVLDNFHFDLSNVATLLEADHMTGSHQPAQEVPREEGKDGQNETPEGRVEADKMAAGDIGEEHAEVAVEEEEEEEEDGMDVEAAGKEGEHGKGNALALKIYHTVMQTILPSLQEVLTKKMEQPGHKLSHHMGSDTDSEILRVPVAMAMTKLLLVLPEEQLHSRLPNVLLKVCNTLKHRSRDVRDVGRSTLVKMAASLGPKYLQYMLKEMKSTLTRGYMLHVLSYSLHYLLRAMATPTPSSSSSSSSSPPSLAPGDLDPCLQLISDILKEDLFGSPAEERESGEGVAKIPESKTPQSYNTYEIVARYLSPKLVPQLLAPIKEMLELHSTSRTCRVVEEVFRRVASGIQQNPAFTPQALLVFIHGVLSNSVPQLAKKPKVKPSATVDLHPPDSRLLPPAPGRSGPKPVGSKNTSSSIVTEFGLQMLHTSLKHGKYDCSSKEHLQMLDPFTALLTSTLSNSAHSKVLCRTLQCLMWVLRLPLASLAEHLDSIVEDIFRLMRRHARMGMAVGANKELVLSAFKAMTVVVRDLKKHDISEEELRILLGFVDEDIHDYQRQSTAFPLLKAILGRKLVVGEMYEVMMKVASLSLTSDSEHVRLQSRQAVLQFILDYPLGKKLNKYLDFHLTNLGYEEQSGRETMLEQVNSIFTKFPERLLNDYSSYFFVPLSLRLINEEAPTCKKMAAATLKTLLTRLSPLKMKEIVSIVETWIQDRLFLHRRLGVLCLGIIVGAESKSFMKRLPTFLPLIGQCLDQQELEREVKQTWLKDQEKNVEGDAENSSEEEGDKEEEEDSGGIVEAKEEEEKEERLAERQAEEMDRLLISSLSTLTKLLHECDILQTSEHSTMMCNIWAAVHKLLVHPHSWVRLLSSRLVGLLFAAHTPEEVVQSILRSNGDGGDDESLLVQRTRRRKRKRMADNGGYREQYLYQDTLHKVQDLCRICCQQLSSPLLSPDLADQVTKNLVFLSKVLHRHEVRQCSCEGRPATSCNEEVAPLSADDKDEMAEERDSVDVGSRVDMFRRQMVALAGDVSDGEEERMSEEKAELVSLGVDRSDKDKKKRDLKWLVARLTRLARFEAGHHPKESIKRTHIFRWTAAVCLDLGPAHLPPYLPSLLRPLHGELSDSFHRAGPDLHTLAAEVVDLVKEVCGKEVFARAYADVQQTAVEARERRKKEAVMEAVMEPEKSMQRKRRKNELKKESKRRKVFSLRPDGTAATRARHHPLT